MTGISEVKCPWCHGRGWDSVEGGRRFDCPDCDGRGYTEICDECGQEVTTGDFCERCWGNCDVCGEFLHNSELFNGMCNDCANEEGRRKNA